MKDINICRFVNIFVDFLVEKPTFGCILLTTSICRLRSKLGYFAKERWVRRCVANVTPIPLVWHFPHFVCRRRSNRRSAHGRWARTPIRVSLLKRKTVLFLEKVFLFKAWYLIRQTILFSIGLFYNYIDDTLNDHLKILLNLYFSEYAANFIN